VEVHSCNMCDYSPQSVLVTGGAGFIGSSVLAHLVHEYSCSRFICVDKLDYCSSIKNLQEVWSKSNFQFVKGDITSSDLINHVIDINKIDTVIHFAAQTHVDNSFGNSLNFTQTNVLGTHVLLESTKLFKHQVKRFIHVSTDEVYGESSLQMDSLPFDEKSAMNPTNPYAATKAAAEFLVKSYAQSFGLPVIITRGNNVYGPRQYPEKLIPKFINLLMQGRPCTIHGSGQHRRSFIFVDDVVKAFDIILHKGVVGQIYNIGTDFEITNLEVARALLNAFSYEAQESTWITFVEDRNFNDVRYHIKSDKLCELGWKPEVAFEDGLRRTIAWYAKLKDHFENILSALVAHPQAGAVSHAVPTSFTA
jgi:dTDP-glucose 4,6-dehydratase